MEELAAGQVKQALVHRHKSKTQVLQLTMLKAPNEALIHHKLKIKVKEMPPTYQGPMAKAKPRLASLIVKDSPNQSVNIEKLLTHNLEGIQVTSELPDQSRKSVQSFKKMLVK